MQLTSLKMTSIGLGLMAIATLSSLTACSTGSQTATPAANPTPMTEMDHGSMGNMSMDLGPADANLDLRFAL